MYRYLFTSDLRISTLDSVMRYAAVKIINDTVPTASEDKSVNNNINTLGFYFNLTQKSNCAKIAAHGNTRKVVLNFVKKFQFPNPRTFDAYNNSHVDGIKLAPMRLILKLLYVMSMVEGKSAHLTKNEIENFIFYNSKATSSFNPDLFEIYSMIKEYRKTKTLPISIEQDDKNKFWNYGDRQLGEMIKILTWSGCVSEVSKGSFSINHEHLTEQDKADIFDIVNYDKFWLDKFPCEKGSFKKVERPVEESYEAYMDISNDEVDVREEVESLAPVGKGENLLIYGVPGCGKSHYIKERYTINDNNSERVVFHPDYTYSDFVGQILPKVKTASTSTPLVDTVEDTAYEATSMMVAESTVAHSVNKSSIEYDFIPGPFTRLLKRCKEYSDRMHYFVIEEINRGNAPAIFGEIFQLLDRDNNGESEYGINNSDIADKVYGNPDRKVVIPNNLTVLATMNTADQNVFTLDTAFKRRWEMMSIRNNFKIRENDADFNAQLECTLCGTDLTWMKFATAINSSIVAQSESNLGSEDKRLGHFFVKPHEMEDVSKFSEKIIMYLWNDVFKFEKENVFNSDYKTLEDVLDAFQEPSVRFKVFAEKLGFSEFIATEDSQAEGDADE